MEQYLKQYDVRFYKTSTWLRTRRRVLARDNGECQACAKAGRYTPATTVHHIEHYERRPDLALTDSNLISLCGACHNAVHPEKSIKGKGSTSTQSKEYYASLPIEVVE